MFALTASHFETFHNPRTEDDPIRRPFSEWLDLVRWFYGPDAGDKAFALLGEEYEDCPLSEPGRILWLASPEYNLEVFVMILGKVKNEYSIV